MEKKDFLVGGWGLMNLRNESQSRPDRLRLTFIGSFYSKILGKLICSFYAEKEGNWRCKESVVYTLRRSYT